jgi:hypothetical protein
MEKRRYRLDGKPFARAIKPTAFQLRASGLAVVTMLKFFLIGHL